MLCCVFCCGNTEDFQHCFRFAIPKSAMANLHQNLHDLREFAALHFLLQKNLQHFHPVWTYPNTIPYIFFAI